MLLNKAGWTSFERVVRSVCFVF